MGAEQRDDPPFRNREAADLTVLGVAKALESQLAGNSETARPVPGIGWLKRQPLIAGSPGFRDFD